MANICKTIYKVRGDRKLVSDFWNKLQELGVRERHVWLAELADTYGISYKKMSPKDISVRGYIACAWIEEYDEYEEALLTFHTDTAWEPCHQLLEIINSRYNYNLSISYRAVEPGGEIFDVHDEFNFFPEECCVSADGEPFDELYEEPFDETSEAIKLWVSKTGIQQGDRSEKEMVEFINDYYDPSADDYDERTGGAYFYIYPFTFID